MVSKRNRILELKEYLSALGISVNIGKNKARGHRGVFMHNFNDFRIDIAKNIDEEGVLSTLLHEFAHYIHYSYDKNLKSLSFVFEDFSDDIREELIKVTVEEVPKEYASKLYQAKQDINNDIKLLSADIKINYPLFKITEKNAEIEKTLPLPLRYLLKYDNVKYFNQILSVEKIDEDCSLNEVQKKYIKLKSKQRALKRINSRISRLNKYYNNNSELFARFVGAYYMKPDLTKRLAPKAYAKLQNSNIQLLNGINKIFD